MTRCLHLTDRDRPAAPTWVAEHDWVVYLPTLTLAPQGHPPLPAGPLVYDQLIELIAAADRVITW